MFNVKMTFIIPFRGNIVKDAKLLVFSNLRKCIHAKISTFTVYTLGITHLLYSSRINHVWLILLAVLYDGTK